MNRMPALCHAAYSNDLLAVEALLKGLDGSEKVDPNAPGERSWNGNTALHYAAQYGYIAIVQILLEHGASRHIKNHLGFLPVDCARKGPIRALLEKVTEDDRGITTAVFKLALVEELKEQAAAQACKNQLYQQENLQYKQELELMRQQMQQEQSQAAQQITCLQQRVSLLEDGCSENMRLKGDQLPGEARSMDGVEEAAIAVDESFRGAILRKGSEETIPY